MVGLRLPEVFSKPSGVFSDTFWKFLNFEFFNFHNTYFHFSYKSVLAHQPGSEQIFQEKRDSELDLVCLVHKEDGLRNLERNQQYNLHIPLAEVNV